MKVSARFNGQGLELVLHAETDPEKRMIGAVLNQPFSDTRYDPCPTLDGQLLHAEVRYDGHWSNKAIESLTLRVHRQEQPYKSPMEQLGTHSDIARSSEQKEK